MMDETLDYLIKIEKHLADLLHFLVEGRGDNPLPRQESEQYQVEFDHLKQLLESPEWPTAVDPDLICDESNFAEKQLRAEGIVDFMIEDPLTGKRFLDFGCGEGLTLPQALQKGAAKAVGYDVTNIGWHNLEPSVTATKEWSAVQAEGPYDLVLMWDVLDHATEPQVELLRRLRDVCHADTKVFVRCHPWSSRSATHAYRSTNKAYIHLVFTDIELVRLGVTGSIPTYKAIHPQITYQKWFSESGFKVLYSPPVTTTEQPEDLFEKDPILSRRIRQNWVASHQPELARGEAYPGFQLSLQFVDYVLGIKD